ncbi:MAG: RnfABCDGE type electron transport complex subunit D [Chloroflexi bacterium]|jgi:Na+-translocating ferredoxin:NAD+ oxidoreductase subunit D|nr:RnfABCDGE type electron transport complex subunit D [Chloroflexota bacterium]MBT7081170.1 RnfABCDGE type electron transport complex subunit D [Chloroflexota bacterium]MBT7288951.1 RnfABCDGE type electron transport complex subunit D [Chloroflexota bacterium]
MQISPPPYLRTGLTVQKRMYFTLLALLPVIAAAVYFYGYRALLIVITSVVTAMLMDYLVKRMRGRPFVMDGSAPLIGILLALTLPPNVALWMVVVGVVFAIGVVKETAGGLGHYVFSPVMASRVFMELSFGARLIDGARVFGSDMGSWAKPTGWAGALENADTPLTATSKTAIDGAVEWTTNRFDMLMGNTPGSIGETSALIILICGLVLIAFRIIDWRFPLSFIGSVAVLSFAFQTNPMDHLLVGGLMLAAFFIITDTVTSPVTRNGKIIVGIGCALFTLMIREWGDAREGVYYAVLLMNALVPLLDRFIKTRPFGFRKEAEIKDA